MQTFKLLPGALTTRRSAQRWRLGVIAIHGRLASGEDHACLRFAPKHADYEAWRKLPVASFVGQSHKCVVASLGFRHRPLRFPTPPSWNPTGGLNIVVLVPIVEDNGLGVTVTPTDAAVSLAPICRRCVGSLEECLNRLPLDLLYARPQ